MADKIARQTIVKVYPQSLVYDAQTMLSDALETKRISTVEAETVRRILYHVDLPELFRLPYAIVHKNTE